MILSDDQSDDDTIDDGTESDENYVETRESVSQCAKDAISDDYYCTEKDAADNCYHWKGKDEVVYGKMFYTNSTQIEKYSEEINWCYWSSKENYKAL